MRRPPSNAERKGVAATVLPFAAALGVFVVEVALPDTVAMVVGYPLIVLASGGSPDARRSTALGAWCTALVLTGMVASPEGALLYDVANRALALVLLWSAVGVMVSRGRPLAEQERLARVAEASPDGVVGIDADGRVVSFNASASALLGVSRDHALGRKLSTLFAPAWRDRVDALVRWRPAGEEIRRLEVAVVAAGESVPLLITSAQVSGVRAEHGSSVSLRDLSAARQVEAALRAEARYRGLLDSAPDAIVIVDADARVVLVNQQAVALFGYDAEELHGRSLTRLVPEEGREPLRAVVDSFFADPSRRRVGVDRPLSGRDRSGRKLPIEVSISPIETDEGLLMAAAIRDVSARVEAEAALVRARDELELRVQERTEALSRANGDLQEFAYVASHDLKAPLRGIAQLAQWLDEDAGPSLSPDARQFVALIAGRAQRLMRLVDDLLAYSRAGHGDGPPDEVDVGALVAEVADMLAPPEGIVVSGVAGLPVLRTWRAPLQQVLFNLVGNAIKHHPGPTGSVRVEASRSGAVWELAVVDDGGGIDPAHHERVWRMFQTLRSRDEVEGSGMGLAIVRRLVERNGGRTWVESAPGQGATFRFTWPEAAMDEAAGD